MSLQGFDKKWKDFPHYIIGITKEIWEDRGISTLHHYYAKDIIVRSPASVVRGNQGVISATMATLAEFPDRQLLGEDVIWSGSAETGDLLSSHRILSTATHLHSGAYGEATGKSLTYRIIADCAARDNMIYDEWLIRDQGAIVRQMGWDAKTYAVDLIAREGGPDRCTQPFTPKNDIAGDYQSKGNSHPVGQRYADLLERIMCADMATIRRDYDRACQLELPGGITAHGGDRRTSSGWAFGQPSPMRVSKSITKSAATKKAWLLVQLCDGVCMGSMKDGAHMVHQVEPRFIFWASRMRSLDLTGCAVNLCSLMKRRSGSRSL